MLKRHGNGTFHIGGDALVMASTLPVKWLLAENWGWLRGMGERIIKVEIMLITWGTV
jgi:hypothetical protein